MFSASRVVLIAAVLMDLVLRKIRFPLRPQHRATTTAAPLLVQSPAYLR
jgi:hypothetical protein